MTNRITAKSGGENAPSEGVPEKTKKKKKKRGWLRQKFKVHRKGGWLLYIWHGMRFGTWWGLLKRGNFDVTLNCIPNILTVTLFSPVNSLLYHISEALFARRVAETEIIEPLVFVLGHWRAGTTYLHELLACDPAFGFPNTYECTFPDHFILSEPAVARWFDVFLPKKRPMDNMAAGYDRPYEDEFALCNLGMPSPYMFLAWPRQGPADEDYLDLRDISGAERRAWIAGFETLLKRITFRQKKPLILKSPTHTARVRTLIESYPNARFIYIARDPYKVYASTINVWKTMNSVQGLHNPARDDVWLDEFVMKTFVRMFRAYDEDRALVPRENLVEIKYEDLVADPVGNLKRIYDQLRLGDFSRAEPYVTDYLSQTGDYQTNVWEMTASRRREIRARWADYIDRFGYGD
ncbi:hypothetical protein MnTg02_01161 [bacterium MnTg02]|nr:hypothetical protein MnTg02_01161 [bacterium MnTg02]